MCRLWEEMGSRVIDPSVINHRTVMRWRASSPPCCCTHGTNAACSHEQEVDWFPEQVWTLWSRKSALVFARNWIRFTRLSSLITIWNELRVYRLPYLLRICYKLVQDAQQKMRKIVHYIFVLHHAEHSYMFRFAMDHHQGIQHKTKLTTLVHSWSCAKDSNWGQCRHIFAA